MYLELQCLQKCPKDSKQNPEWDDKENAHIKDTGSITGLQNTMECSLVGQFGAYGCMYSYEF